MQMNPFTWLRHRTREAFLQGLADAVADVSQDGPPVPVAAIEALQERLTLALAAPAQRETAGRKASGK
jgi:hypothetical protein